MNRRAFLFMAAGAASCSRRTPRTALQKAAAYLWEQQAEDGGFHSTTYGLLRSGQSLTPFVLGALLDVPESALGRPGDHVARAFAFIRKNTNADGALGRMDFTSADYPNYATALAVNAFSRARPEGCDRDIRQMVAHLRAQQFTEGNGWKETDAPYGAWGMGGPIHRPPETGHVDLSMTRCVLEALRAVGVPSSDPAMQSALVYLKRSQNPDGGFYFSVPNPEINKAGEVDGHFRSYGTATADGILALRAAGIPESDARLASATRWLTEHHQSDRAPGFDSMPRELWSGGLRFYYAGIVSRAAPFLPITLPEQLADGSFRNANPMVKEDDPLIATSFAVSVLSRGR